MDLVPNSWEGSDSQLTPLADSVWEVLQKHGPGARAALEELLADLAERAEGHPVSSYERGVFTGMAAVALAAGRAGRRSPLAESTGLVEAGTLAERLLLEIGRGVAGSNAEIAERLGTDDWQLSRAGRRLREVGLAERTRSGRTNQWRLTPAGYEAVAERSRRSEGR